MFTGLVEATGRVVELIEKGAQAQLNLEIPFAAEMQAGESIAINGCCLTTTRLDGSIAQFDVLSQTLRVTNLGRLKTNHLVNLERALKASDRLGGHFVQGHVDATSEVLDFSPHGQDYRLTIRLDASHRKAVIDKGSIAINGISLTAAEVTPDEVTCWIIPHTRQVTQLIDCQPGDIVNLEFDVLGKYVQAYLENAS